MSHKGFRNLNNLFLSALGTSDSSKFINMKRFDITLGKESQ